MGRKPRNMIITNDSFFHTMWQCHDKKWLLESDWAKQLYYDLLLKYKAKYGLIFHSYHFMDNHVHLTGKAPSLESFSNYFRTVNSLFSRKFNKKFNRYGQTIMQRFLSPNISDDRHMLAVMAYIDLNSVRAGKHKDPEETDWSSYKYYAYDKIDPLINTVPSYFNLGQTNAIRQQVYRNLVKAQRMMKG